MNNDRKNIFILIEILSRNIMDNLFFSIDIEDLNIKQCIILYEIGVLCRVTLTNKKLKEILVAEDSKHISKDICYLNKCLKSLRDKGYIDLNYAGKKINPIITLTKKGADTADIIRSHLDKISNSFGEDKLQILYKTLQELDVLFKKNKKENFI